MSDSENQRASGKSAFDLGADILSMVLAGVLTFFAGPAFFKFTVEFVVAYGAEQIGAGLEPLVTLAWVFCCAVGVFGFNLMIVALTVKLGAAKFGKFFFRR